METKSESSFSTRKIILIQCCKRKFKGENKAENLYISPLFRLSLAYAKSLNPQAIHILSAKYGLLELTNIIENYNITLKNMDINERKKWSDKIINDLKKRYDLKKDHFIFLAGIYYREFLLENISFFEIPLKNLTIGKQIQKLQILLQKNKEFNL